MSAPSFRRPDPIEVEACPRSGGPARRMATLSERDAWVWHDLGRRVAPAIEERLGPNVVANRARPDRGSWRLEGLESSLRRLRARVRNLTGGGASPGMVLATDVEDFYPSVTPGAVSRALAFLGVDREEIAATVSMLDGWESLGYPGLPIGPPASAVLANAVLAPIDASVGARFVRWVDDYLVAGPTESQAAEVLERMDSALARLGLTRSRRKTRTGEPTGWLGSALGGSRISAPGDGGG